MKKNTVKYIIIGIVLVVLAFFYSHISKMNLIYDKNVDNSEYLETALQTGDILTQRFVSAEDTFDGVSIKLKSVNVAEGDTVQVGILDSDLNEIAIGKINQTDIKSGKFNKIYFDEVQCNKGDVYYLKVVADCKDSLSYIVYYRQPEAISGTELKINDETVPGTFVAKTITKRFDMETFVVTVLIIIFIAAFTKMLYKLFK